MSVTEPQPAVPKPNVRWYRLTPDRLILALLVVGGFLLLSEWFRWLPFNEHKGWTLLIVIEIVAVTILLPLIPFVLASDAAHPHPHQAKYKPMPRDLYYPKGKVVKFYVQHTLKIRTDQLAASNAPAPVQGGIDTHPKPQNQDTSTPRSAGSETTTVFVIPIK